MLNWILGMTALSLERFQSKERENWPLVWAMTDATNFSREFSYRIAYKRITTFDIYYAQRMVVLLCSTVVFDL